MTCITSASCLLHVFTGKCAYNKTLYNSAYACQIFKFLHVVNVWAHSCTCVKFRLSYTIAVDWMTQHFVWLSTAASLGEAVESSLPLSRPSHGKVNSPSMHSSLEFPDPQVSPIPDSSFTYCFQILHDHGYGMVMAAWLIIIDL